jgi:hypothetical protein
MVRYTIFGAPDKRRQFKTSDDRDSPGLAEISDPEESVELSGLAASIAFKG